MASQFDSAPFLIVTLNEALISFISPPQALILPTFPSEKSTSETWDTALDTLFSYVLEKLFALLKRSMPTKLAPRWT
eukprot:g33809.t1